MAGDQVSGHGIGADIHLDRRRNDDVLLFVEAEQVGRLVIVAADRV